MIFLKNHCIIISCDSLLQNQVDLEGSFENILIKKTGFEPQVSNMFISANIVPCGVITDKSLTIRPYVVVGIWFPPPKLLVEDLRSRRPRVGEKELMYLLARSVMNKVQTMISLLEQSPNYGFRLYPLLMHLGDWVWDWHRE